MARNYYDVLGIGKDSSEKDVRSAYRRLARQYHPDVNPGDGSAEAKFKEINEAYRVLSSQDSRKKYDRFGPDWRYADQMQDPRSGQSPFTWFTHARQRGFRDSQSTRFGGLGDVFGAGRHVMDDLLSRQRLEVPIMISLEEACTGTTRTVQSPPNRVTGRPGKRLEVRVPAGTDNNARIHVSANQDGVPVDLYLTVTVAPDRTFERDGDNLRATVDVPLLDAILGGEIEVQTIVRKAVALRIPPGTQNGSVFRLREKGMAKRWSGHGDLLVTVKVVLPTNLTPDQLEIFAQLRETGMASQ